MSINLFDLTGKVALITGATHGLGMAMATGIGKAGAKIVVNGNSSQEKLDKAVAIYRAAGIDAYGYLFNVADEHAVKKSIAKIEAEVGAIDILVNNAGIIKRIPLVDMEVADFKEVIDIDLVAPFIVSKHVLKGMIARKNGKIINICSMMSELGRNSVGAYAVTKGGLKMLTQNMATEWAKFNIQYSNKWNWARLFCN
jgi:gluconate 5-dehydrogenase